MSSFFQQCLQQVMAGQTLRADQMHELVSLMMDGQADPLQTAGLLCVMASRGETAEEFTGAARAMRERVTQIRSDGTGVLDTCGTGGSGLKTFNISTAAAIVCASGGVPVAKHGNRSITSTSGSADVLERLGVNLEMTPAQVNASLETVGLGFCFAPLLHQAMKNVGPIRRALGVRTIFNMLGPLTNPAHAEFQLLGTIRNHYAQTLAAALNQLGTRRSLVICGNNEVDELCLWGPNIAYLVEDGKVREMQFLPEELGLPQCSLQDIQVETAQESAALISRILSGEQIPARGVVILNAAAGLWIAGKATTLQQGIQLAAELIDQKEAFRKLQQLQNFSAGPSLSNLA